MPAIQRRSPTEGGFTLVELMVVVVIVGILASVAGIYIKQTDYSKGVRGYSSSVAALLEAARINATASGKIQQVEIQTQAVIHSQYSEEGMAEIDAGGYSDVKFIQFPSDVRVYAYSDRAHADAGDSVPSDGAGLPATITFYPDGTATSGTVFITDDARHADYRVTVFGTSGSVMTLQDF